MQAADIMNKPVISVGPEMTVKELARVLADTNAKITDGRGVCRPELGSTRADGLGAASPINVAPVAAPKR